MSYQHLMVLAYSDPVEADKKVASWDEWQGEFGVELSTAPEDLLLDLHRSLIKLMTWLAKKDERETSKSDEHRPYMGGYGAQVSLVRSKILCRVTSTLKSRFGWVTLEELEKMSGTEYSDWLKFASDKAKDNTVEVLRLRLSNFTARRQEAQRCVELLDEQIGCEERLLSQIQES